MNEYNYKEDAIQYDELIKEYDSYVHDVLFGMCFEYVKPNENLLDLGIGTGLASINFSKIRLKIYGLDNSEDMLEICRKKSFAEELTLHNLLEDRIPYNDRYFDHVICSGVFHFISDLENIFSETARVIKESGIFAFTFAPDNKVKDFIKQLTSWNVPIFRHSPDYIKRILNKNGMELLKEMRFLVKGVDKKNYDMLFSVMIAKLK